MIEAVYFMFGVGASCGFVLSLASKAFYVYEDPRISKVEGVLAGANCGGCGYAGCSAAASAIVEGKAPVGACVIGGLEVATKVATIMGKDPGVVEPVLSMNTCNGGNRAELKYFYMGVNTCKAKDLLYGGDKVCEIGCLGFGDCIKACKFNAIEMGKDGYPIVNEANCVGCGACADACPRTILHIKTMSERLLSLNTEDDALAPCRQTCPAEIDIPKYIAQIKAKDYIGAINTIRERNPLLLACGRVCPHPCEDKCRRGIEDEPVSINQLKRFVADYEMLSGTRIPISCAPSSGKKVAVIGGGPAGLSCAYFLRRVGHDVSIYDDMPKLGGMIRYGIPEYRLPKDVLQWEIQGILNLGIKAYRNVKLSKDFHIGALVAAGYDAIFLGVGAWKDFRAGIGSMAFKGSYTGISFLTQFAKYQQGASGAKNIPIGKKCVVIGGGNTAIDCVRTLVRLGAKEVTLVYRRTKKEMPANLVEIEAAEHEGVKFLFLAAPLKIMGDEDKNMTAFVYQKMELGAPDKSGRRSPVPIPGSDTIMEADMFIAAIGQSPDTSFMDGSPKKMEEEFEITKWDTIGVDNLNTPQSKIPYIFAAGDALTGALTVVSAVGGGRRAARAIDLFLKDKPVIPPNKVLASGDKKTRNIKGTIFEKVEGIKKIPRAKMPELLVPERIKSFVECDLVLNEESALKEANRCLSCCRICYDKDIA